MKQCHLHKIIFIDVWSATHYFPYDNILFILFCCFQFSFCNLGVFETALIHPMPFKNSSQNQRENKKKICVLWPCIQKLFPSRFFCVACRNCCCSVIALYASHAVNLAFRLLFHQFHEKHESLPYEENKKLHFSSFLPLFWSGFCKWSKKGLRKLLLSQHHSRSVPYEMLPICLNAVPCCAVPCCVLMFIMTIVNLWMGRKLKNICVRNKTNSCVWLNKSRRETKKEFKI